MKTLTDKDYQELYEEHIKLDKIKKGFKALNITRVKFDKWFLMVELANAGVVIDVKDLGNLDAVKEMVKVLKN